MKWGKFLLLFIVILCISLPLILRRPIPSQIGVQVETNLSEEARQELIHKNKQP